MTSPSFNLYAIEPTSRGGIDGVGMPGKTRRAVACTHCRAKKIRCNGSVPCANCQDRAEECVVTARRRPRVQGNQGSHDYDSADLSRRVRQIETLLRTPAEGSKLEHRVCRLATEGNGLSGALNIIDQTSILPQHDRNHGSQRTYSETPDHVFEPIPSHQVPSTSQSLTQQPGDHNAIPPSGDNSSPNALDTQDIEQEGSSVYVTETPTFEYYGKQETGPRSVLSFCSEPGMDWVVSKVKSPNFRDVAKGFVANASRMLKMSGTLSTLREPEPSPEVAWQYTKAYFEETPEEAFEIVDRSWFESRLRAHFSGAMPDDKALYALRNVLWASGCRIVLSKTASCREASRTSWALFENALSVHTEILFSRASMTGVQALVLMAYYSEGVGKMSLQYMLCSSALRLACAKGLHRQPARSWNISPHEVEHRNWLFWSIYCLEKHICSRSGRPSVMDDDEISCQTPENASSGRPGDTIYCHMLIKLMQLSSTAKKRLSSARGLRQTPEQLIETVHDLGAKLDELKSSTQHQFCLDGPLEVSQLPNDLTLRQAQSLQYHYFCLVLDINTPLAYPWSGICTYAKHNKSAFDQIKISLNLVAEASRSAILATRQIRIDASCSALLPLMSILSPPMKDGLPDGGSGMTNEGSDIALGYFSNLEFATDFELSFRPFAREMCHYARLAVDQSEKTRQRGIDDMRTKTGDQIASTNNQMTESLDFTSAALPSNEDEFFGWLPDEDLEAWSTLISFPETGDYASGDLFL
ncbi:hypothetical protein H2200_005077 [Cladophialophora chaetospira]|uniref:Zn(2)-C6 fungal-type domain-containing protein n=1 Tax=Cladophialophora chaetospira TaxID=386627 RepID=A0AA38XBA2_9EURO|nr:hypothetical protein H2200_005077 [Cladophialophora chaetospira]